MRQRTYISFDWALKRLLRDKANFDVLEGFLTTLLKQDIKINRILESEGNIERRDAKSNRVDLLAENTEGVKYLIEVQGESEFAYFQRILFGTSKLITDYISAGDNYENVQKVYSINIVYFDLGQGKDVVYHGKTEFRGTKSNELLSLSPFQRQKFGVNEVYQLYPEYYILKVNDFNQWSRDPLEQWLYFLSTSDIPDNADAPGLQSARQKMTFLQMTESEKNAYNHYLDDRTLIKNQITTAHGEGMIEGRKEGLIEGKREGLIEGKKELNYEHARSMLQLGIAPDIIKQVTGLSIDEINALNNPKQ